MLKLGVFCSATQDDRFNLIRSERWDAEVQRASHQRACRTLQAMPSARIGSYISCVSSTTSSISSLIVSSCSARCASRKQGYILHATILERPAAVDAMNLNDSIQARRTAALCSRRSLGSAATCSSGRGMPFSSSSRSSHVKVLHYYYAGREGGELTSWSERQS